MRNKYYIGDACCCWQLGDTIDESITHKVIYVYKELKKSEIDGVLDVVPSYNSVAVHMDLEHDNIDAIEEEIDTRINALLSNISAQASVPDNVKTVEISVQYDGCDLHRVVESSGLTEEQVIDTHSSASYAVAMIGFLPHFPYLIGMDHRLQTPRLDTPRKLIPAGSVAIGGAQTGVYPVDSPGGWNIIGSCNPEILSDLLPGDNVVFRKQR